MSIYKDLNNAAISAANKGDHKLASEIDNVQMELSWHIREFNQNLTIASMQDLTGCWVRAMKLLDQGFNTSTSPRAA